MRPEATGERRTRYQALRDAGKCVQCAKTYVGPHSLRCGPCKLARRLPKCVSCGSPTRGSLCRRCWEDTTQVRKGEPCAQCAERPRMARRTICARCRARGYRERYALTAHGDGVHKCDTCGQAGHNSRTCRSAAPPRCRCGLSLPCNSCLPTAAELGSARLPWT